MRQAQGAIESGAAGVQLASVIPVFHARGLSKSYHMDEVDVCALRDVNLDIFEREIRRAAGLLGLGKIDAFKHSWQQHSDLKSADQRGKELDHRQRAHRLGTSITPNSETGMIQ